ncbi:MAG: ABC transporter permease [Treponema sp.]|nr:ABC transporter permease [Treponema sp.]
MQKAADKTKKRGLWGDAWLRMRRNKSAVAGIIMLLIILIAVYSAPLYIDYDTDVLMPNFDRLLEFPSPGTLLGGDELGRDVFARIIWGGRISISLSFASTILSLLMGLTLGSIAGYYGDVLDTLIMRFLDIFMAIPNILLMITIVSVMRPSLLTLLLALSIGGIPGSARMIKAQILKVKDSEYIEAIRAQGASDLRIILGHILPNAISPLISQYLISIAGGIMAISGLSFIGLGVQPPNPEWGSMLASGRAFIRDAWHVTAFPGIAIVLTIIAITLVGDGLRDALDPRMKR